MTWGSADQQESWLDANAKYAVRDGANGKACSAGEEYRSIFRAQKEACPKYGTAAWASIALPVRLESLPLLIRRAWIRAKSTPPGGW